MTVSRDKSVTENEPGAENSPAGKILYDITLAALVSSDDLLSGLVIIDPDALRRILREHLGDGPANATRCTGSKDNPCSSVFCPVHGRYFARGWKPVAENWCRSQHFYLTGYDDGDRETYALVLTHDGEELSVVRVLKYKLYNFLAHIEDQVDQYCAEPAPTTAADSPNAGVETPRAAAPVDSTLEVSGKPEAAVDVSRAPSVSGRDGKQTSGWLTDQGYIAPSVSGYEWVILKDDSASSSLFNLGAAKALHAGGVEAILSQMKLHAEIVAGMTETIREKDAEIARLRDADALIEAALKRQDVHAGFSLPESVVVSVHENDDDSPTWDTDLLAAFGDRYFSSVFAWCVRIAMGEKVVMEGRDDA